VNAEMMLKRFDEPYVSLHFHGADHYAK